MEGVTPSMFAEKDPYVLIWAASRQNQHSAFATSMDQDQLSHPHRLIRIHAVRLLSLLQVEKLVANSIEPDQTGRKFVVTRLICSYFLFDK
jgi:hypothetical protein